MTSMVPVWPLHGIRLRTTDLDLRPATESDLPGLCAIVPDDLEVDPSTTRYAGLGGRDNHQVAHLTVLPHTGQTLQHLRLEHRDWIASGQGGDVVTEGIGAGAAALWTGGRP